MGRAVKTALLAAYILPLLVLMGLSFADAWPYPHLLPVFSTAAWRDALGSVGSAVGLSVGIALLVSLVSTAAGFIAAYAVACSARKGLWRWLALIPFATAPVVLALELKYYFIGLGLSAHPVGVVLGHMSIAVPYAVVLFSLFWDGGRMAHDELARTLGAGGWQRLLRVHVPASRGALALVATQLFIFSWLEYGLVTTLGSGRVQTLTVKVFGYAQEANLALAATACTVLVLPPSIVLIFTKRIRLR
ncbi:MAG: ABC transporter permease [Flavobacteriales bacterium]